ncbi:unnamed protein product [marine sediment metagenome]|uniref:Uncharacterized protein n=1 Tax=marine sediment metagenome TaxID=412755 RepID=X1E6S6_9ZZZZ
MESLIDHIISEYDLDERTPERLILLHDGDYVKLSGPLAYRRALYAHNSNYSVFLSVSDTVLYIPDGATRLETLSEPATPVDGAEYRDLYLMAAEEPSSGVIIKTGPYGIEYYNPLLNAYGALAPVDVPVGSKIGIRAHGLNDLPWTQSMSIYVYIYDPDGVQIKMGLGINFSVRPGGRVPSGNVEVVADKPGTYTATIKLWAVIP